MTRQKVLILIGLSYLVLLGASYVVRLGQADSTRLPDRERIELLDSSEEAQPRRVEIAYQTWGNSKNRNKAASVDDPRDRRAVLLLHGSPGSSNDFLSLGPLLGEERRVLALDLPGFGGSETRVPDYSIKAHAAYVERVLDQLGIDSVHVLGFSMGGGVALELAAKRPDRVASLVLLSSIGVQELELLGNYSLNHGVHAVQLAALWALHHLTPHFGLLDGFPLDVPYARNFYDTDQRPLRDVLADLEMPSLVVHGEHDFLVPAAAAREHHRLVPQSELVMLNSGHFMVFNAADRLAPSVATFFDRVEVGAAADRYSADPKRLEAAEKPFDPSVTPTASGVTLFVLLALIALATLVSEDATCIATGLLVSQGRIGFLAGSAACAAGILIGDLLIYAGGRFLGRPALGYVPFKWILSPQAIERSSDWFDRRGPVVITASRFLPGTRVATYFSAGLLGAGFWKFLGYFLLAVVLWTPILVGLSAWLGTRIYDYFEAFQRWALPGAIALALFASALLTLGRRLASWHGRRRLLGALRRKLEWEFWPWWLLYIPMLGWIFWLGLRHRGLMLFTAANPGIQAGGFVGESKNAILTSLAPESVARFIRIGSGAALDERKTVVREFLDRNSLELPVVIKPDVGERGSGVRIVRDEGQLEEALSASRGDLLVQEYITGPELGIFYIRMPSEENGRIFSITEKQLPRVTGDGRATIEELILRDDRAMRKAPIHLDRLAGELDRIPSAGTVVDLVELGVHSCGALFLDGAHFHTTELEQAIDKIGRSFDGFFFGRFDLRASSFESFRRGKDLKVLELNGVTSEATHIYDPKNSLLDAYRVLFRQWELAFEIGRQNRDLGIRPTGLGTLIRLIAQHVF